MAFIYLFIIIINYAFSLKYFLIEKIKIINYIFLQIFPFHFTQS